MSSGSSGRWWSASPGSSVQQPLLDAQPGGSSGGSWWQRSPSSQTSSSATAPSQSSYQPPGSEVPQLQRLAPPARGGSLFQAHADLSSATSTSSKQSDWIATIQKNIESVVRETSQGNMPTREREEMFTYLAEVQKNREDHGSGAS
jgi:hypothetical protein